jgi:hypothetical protein
VYTLGGIRARSEKGAWGTGIFLKFLRMSDEKSLEIDLLIPTLSTGSRTLQDQANFVPLYLSRCKDSAKKALIAPTEANAKPNKFK